MGLYIYIWHTIFSSSFLALKVKYWKVDLLRNTWLQETLSPAGFNIASLSCCGLHEATSFTSRQSEAAHHLG